MVQHLPQGSKQVLRTRLDKKGKFGGILGEFVIDKTTINDLLIDQHHAVPYTGQSKSAIAEAHLENREHVSV